MDTKPTKLMMLIGALAAAAFESAAALHAAGAPPLQPMLVNGVTGSLRIQQSLPGTCDNVDQNTPITSGRLELSPAEGIDVPGGKQLTLTRAVATFAPFTIERHCMAQDVVKNYSQVAVQLNRSAAFTAVATGPDTYAFTIPKASVEFFESSLINGEVQPGYMQPKEDVTGTIDLAQRIFSMQVRIATKVHIEFGCIPHVGCAINDDYGGTLTASFTGTIVLPDSDGDGVIDQSDNCRFYPNPDQSPVATPRVTAPAPVTLASCLDSAIGAASAADLCDARPLSVASNAPLQFAIGGNVVTWTAQDSKGRTGTAAQTVTVVDTTAPAFTFVPLDITRNNCGPVDLGTPAAADDCAGTPTFTNNAPAIFLKGVTAVTWTAKDVSGNQATAAQSVTVFDTVPPEISCVPTTGSFYRVVAVDACLGAIDIRLGTHVLAPGEVIKIEETGSPGIRLVNVLGPGGERHFLVGRGEAVITAADDSGNVASTSCVR
jgi:hypothetical protein